VFLHLIQVSGPTVENMVASQVREQGNQIKLTFSVAARTCTITLNKTGDVGGHVKIIEGDKLVVDRDLTREIMPQSGLALTPQLTEPKARVTLDQDLQSAAAVELAGIGKPAVERLIESLPSPERNTWGELPACQNKVSQAGSLRHDLFTASPRKKRYFRGATGDNRTSVLQNSKVNPGQPLK
jgi:hypothetical protein